jgi:5-methylcytosine-specific restriction protein A
MRLEFSKRTKLEAWTRANGHCEECTAKLSTGQFEYHHILEATMGGDNGLRNCKVLCRTCHGIITGSRSPVIAKSNRQRNKHIGISKQSSRPFPGGKASPFKRKITGEVVKR